jgi:hypothetical protein
MAKPDTKLRIPRKLLESAGRKIEVCVHGLVNEDGEIQAGKKPRAMVCGNLGKLGAAAVCPNVADCKDTGVLLRLEPSNK